MKVYIGHDPREQQAFDVAAISFRAFGCEVIPLRSDVLRAAGILTRTTDTRGQMWDFNSSANQSTEFAITRFAVPILAHAGWCLFADSDTLCMANPDELLAVADPQYAVMVVKHVPLQDEGTKMRGQIQAAYQRKNWSSVCLWNVDHPANRRLNLTTLNQWPGRDLHAFKWLADSEIGELSPEWNHLVGINRPNDGAKILHFTQGVPTMPGYENCESADVWRSVASQR